MFFKFPFVENYLSKIFDSGEWAGDEGMVGEFEGER